MYTPAYPYCIALYNVTIPLKIQHVPRVAEKAVMASTTTPLQELLVWTLHLIYIFIALKRPEWLGSYA